MPLTMQEKLKEKSCIFCEYIVIKIKKNCLDYKTVGRLNYPTGKQINSNFSL